MQTTRNRLPIAMQTTRNRLPAQAMLGVMTVDLPGIYLDTAISLAGRATEALAALLTTEDSSTMTPQLECSRPYRPVWAHRSPLPIVSGPPGAKNTCATCAPAEQSGCRKRD